MKQFDFVLHQLGKSFPYGLGYLSESPMSSNPPGVAQSSHSIYLSYSQTFFSRHKQHWLDPRETYCPLPNFHFVFQGINCLLFTNTQADTIQKTYGEMKIEPGWVAGEYVPLLDRELIWRTLFEGLFHRAFLRELHFNLNTDKNTNSSQWQQNKRWAPPPKLILGTVVTWGYPAEPRSSGTSFVASDLMCLFNCPAEGSPWQSSN